MSRVDKENSFESIAMRQRQYIRAIRPYTKLKEDIYSRVIPTKTVYPDGRVEHRYIFTKEQQGLLEQIDEAIELMRERFIDGGVPKV